MDVSLWVRFTATQRCERGAAHRVLIEPSFDDPCTALCIIDRALSRALQLESYPKFEKRTNAAMRVAYLGKF
jgi:hypothetical protein